MKVLFVSEYFPPKIMGGGEINLFSVAKALVAKGINVSVLTSFEQGLKRYEEMAGIKVYRRLQTGSSPGGILSNFKRSILLSRSVENEVQNLAKNFNFDIIHFIGISVMAARKLKHLRKKLLATIESYPSLCPKGDRIYHGKKECKIKCSFTEFLSCQQKSPEIGKVKNCWYLKYNPLILFYVYNFHKKLKDSLKYCQLVAISEYIQKVLLQHGQGSTVIPNAMDVSKFACKTKREQNEAEKTKKVIMEENGNKNKEKTKIIYLGSLIKSKGPQVLLKAVKELNCKCDFYGNGILENELRKTIEKNNLDAEIHAPIPYEQIPEVYANADIVVFPSIWPEPFGRIAIEAMASGKPCIGSRIGAIQETITPESGILVEPGNVTELRTAIQKLANDSLLRKELGESGRKRAEEYAEEKVINQLISLYQRVVDSK